MAICKKIIITTQSREVVVIRSSRRITGFCLICNAERGLTTLDDASTITFRGTRNIIAEIDTGVLHAVENNDGRLFICTTSLEKSCEGEL